MLFKILSVTNGWFSIDFNREFVLTNSDYLQCDAPALFLDAVCNLMEQKATVQWLCWQNEPEAQVLRLEAYDGDLMVEIYGADQYSMKLDYSGPALSEHITKLLYSTQDDMHETAKHIFMEFALYENGNGLQRYKHHWGTFPAESYNRLKRLLGVKRL